MSMLLIIGAAVVGIVGLVIGAILVYLNMDRG
jgi:hypothetical protein